MAHRAGWSAGAPSAWWSCRRRWRRAARRSGPPARRAKRPAGRGSRDRRSPRCSGSLAALVWTFYGAPKQNGGPQPAVRWLRVGSSLHRIPGAVARSDALLLRVLRRVGLDLLAHQLAVRLHPVGEHFPLRAVPLLELHQARALVVEAGHLERRHEADRTQLLQALVVDVQVLDAPAHLLAGDRLALAELRLGEADRLGGHDARHHAARVVDRAEARLVLELALALVVDELLDVFHHREVRARRVEAGGDVALGGRAGGQHVLFGA